MASRGSTIRDVAQHAGVSISTVSKAFNNKGSLSSETRLRVLTAAAALHFHPNALIRSLRQGQTYAIGVFTWDAHEDSSRDITLQLARGIAQGITTARYDMVTYSHMPERTPSHMASVFLDGRIDGVIVGPNDVDASGLAALAAAGLPTVAVYRRDVPEGIGYVAVDNQSGVTAAMEHLLTLGHTRIAFYAPLRTYDFDERTESYRETLRQAGIAPDPDLCLQGTSPFTESETPQAACDRFLSLPNPPTALIAGDDAQALLCLEELCRRGLRIPEDISLVGFDDVSAATSFGLTTVRQPAREVGKTAARFVKARIDGASAEECRTLLPVEMIVRSTTAPLPTGKRP